MIENLKDLEKLLKLMRKQGVTEIKLSGTEIKLGDLPQTQSEIPYESTDAENKYSDFPDGILTPEQLAFYSSGGVPENDPELKQ